MLGVFSGLEMRCIFLTVHERAGAMLWGLSHLSTNSSELINAIAEGNDFCWADECEVHGIPGEQHPHFQ